MFGFDRKCIYKYVQVSSLVILAHVPLTQLTYKKKREKKKKKKKPKKRRERPVWCRVGDGHIAKKTDRTPRTSARRRRRCALVRTV